MKVLIATGNAGKAREFAEMLGPSGAECFNLSTIASAVGRQITEPEETGETFRANACLKASYYAAAAGCWAMADDSGLEVDALGRSPGVKSARWAKLHNAGSGDQANSTLLLQQMKNIPDSERAGRFVCVLALADPTGRVVLTARDTVEGSLLRSPRGSNGFGYDPLFLVGSLGRTTAELSPAEKHAISHRGKAMKTMQALIEQLGVFTYESPSLRESPVGNVMLPGEGLRLERATMPVSAAHPDPGHADRPDRSPQHRTDSPMISTPRTN